MGLAPLTIAMVAGESSGDNLGAPLIRSIKSARPDARFIGIGGPAMIAEGFESYFDIERLSVNGFPVARVPELIRILYATKTELLKNKPDCFIGVDYNFFNGLLEGMMKRAHVRTVHYVSPTIWAWRSGRVRKIKKDIDLMLTLYPFETAIYEKHDIPVKFVGHPKANEIALDQGQTHKEPARRSLGFAADELVIAIMPGSRAGEVALSGPDFFATAERLSRDLDCKFVIPAATSKRQTQIRELWQSLAPHIPVLITEGNALEVMAAADAVMVNSGTATLEAMLLRRPMVMSYRLGKLTYALVSPLVRAPYFALPNILAGRQLVPEFMQDAADPDAMAAAMKEIIENPHTELLAEFDRIHRQLRCETGEIAAAEILKLCEAPRVSA